MYVVYLRTLWETDSRQVFKVSGEMPGDPFHLRFNGTAVALCCFCLALENADGTFWGQSYCAAMLPPQQGGTWPGTGLNQSLGLCGQHLGRMSICPEIRCTTV